LWASSAMRSLAPVAVALAVVAALAGSVGGLGAGKSNLRPQTASDVFTVALTLLAIAVAAGSVAFASSLPLPSLLTLSNEPRRRSSFAQRCLAVVVLATAVGVGELLLRRRARTLHATVAGTAGRQVHHVALSSVRFSAPAAGYTLLAVLVVAALAIGLPAWRRRRWATALGPLVPMQAHPGPDALAGDARDGSLPAAIMAVSVANPEDEPDSRRAIVAAYLAMTQAAASCGAPREPNKTASEYLRRLLGIAGAPVSAARALTSIFERARYSREAIGEEGRSLAITCLREIREGIEAPS
jgi:hypothetical protein